MFSNPVHTTPPWSQISLFRVETALKQVYLFTDKRWSSGKAAIVSADGGGGGGGGWGRCHQQLRFMNNGVPLPHRRLLRGGCGRRHKPVAETEQMC